MHGGILQWRMSSLHTMKMRYRTHCCLGIHKTPCKSPDPANHFSYNIEVYTTMNFRDFLIVEALQDLLNDPSSLASKSRQEIQYMMPPGFSKASFIKRNELTRTFSWSIPCKEAIDAIKQFARPPLIDVMAGTGFWAKVLNAAGIQTIPYDLHNAAKYNPYKHRPQMPIKRQNALKTAYKIKNRGVPRDILLSWPPHGSPVAYDAVAMLPIGSRIFYVGESGGGCTGDSALAAFFEKNCTELAYVHLPRFEGIYDNLWIYEITKSYPINPKLRGKSGFWNDDELE